MKRMGQCWGGYRKIAPPASTYETGPDPLLASGRLCFEPHPKEPLDSEPALRVG